MDYFLKYINFKITKILKFIVNKASNSNFEILTNILPIERVIADIYCNHNQARSPKNLCFSKKFGNLL